ncbi:MAG: pyruvate dehydrogenase complex dihydrolipoamide acetyltransferase [Bradyrhizobiaceae bacterium]|nr:MAG: pyruvate dehydrogenase complex dihydrolipoamide acetyltransferase [Bradyrhizobiaceae bacterium]
MTGDAKKPTAGNRDPLARLSNFDVLSDKWEAKSRELTLIDPVELASYLKSKVIGQNSVIDSVVTRLHRRMAAKRPNKPIAVFCFAGAPGVGKTYLAQVLAEKIYGSPKHLHYIDMTKFGSEASSWTLFGSAAGHVGSSRPGLLPRYLRDVPNSIVLLDEIEKAHRSILTQFLSAWNDGFITELSDGSKHSTNEAIFIMTTNAGRSRIAELARDPKITQEELNKLAKSALQDAQFAPEVLSRVDDVFAFRELAGLDIARVQGSGPHGRVVARDVEAARSGGVAMRTPAPAPAAPAAPLAIEAPSDEKIRALFEPGSYELVPHDNMRRIIARRLTEAKLTIPHFYLTLDCVIDRLLTAREEINAAAPKDKEGKPAYKLSVNDFVIKALAIALQQVPDANVSWTEGGMLKHKHSDVGVAVAIPGGLITPVVRRAEVKSVSIISNEMKDYAVRARARKLKPEEYQGGSTAVSNLGMYGIKDFAAVINPPHATILAVGAGEQRPVARAGRVEVATVMSVTLSTDHRAVDGALGSELMAAFKRLIENPVMMVV